MPQVGRWQNERAADHEWWAVERVDGLLVDIDGSGKSAANRREREFKTLPPPDNPNRSHHPGEYAEDCEGIAP